MCEGSRDYISRCRSGLPVLARVPRGAIISAVDALNLLLTQVIEKKSELAWGRLLNFSYWEFRRPSTNGSDGVSLATKVKKQVSDFLGSDSLSTPPRANVRQKDGSDVSNIRLKKRMSAKFSDGDVKGAVRFLASEEEYDPQDDRTLTRLAQKHPAVPNYLSMPLPPDDSSDLD